MTVSPPAHSFFSGPALLSALLFIATPARTTALGSAGIWKPPADAEAALFAEDFERVPAAKLPEGYQLKKDTSAPRSHVLFGEVTAPNQALKYTIPFNALSNRTFTLSFYAKSPDQARCAIWITQHGQKRLAVGQIEELPKQWKKFSFSGSVPTDAPGVIELVAPSSYGSNPGEAFLDSIELRAAPATGPWLEHPEDFPALCGDNDQNLWLAVTARPDCKTQLRLYRVTDNARELSFTFEPEGITGIGTPDIAPRATGCVVSVPVERKGLWDVAVLFFNAKMSEPTAVHYLNAGGAVNIEAALDVRNDQALVVWQGNRDLPRRIYSACVTPEKASPVRAVSAAKMPASNPDVVYIDDTTAFAAWDSFDGDSVNLYGCYFRNGAWEDVKQITSDPRIERHVSLAAHRNAIGRDELWLAWQAQSFQKHLINKMNEQRIVVAQLRADGLRVVPRVFDEIKGTSAEALYVRPQIACAPNDGLILTARKSLGAQKGWRAQAWIAGERGLCELGVPWAEQGRWRPVPIAIHKDGAVAACQRDNLPSNWGVDTGQAPDWKSDVVLVEIPNTGSLTFYRHLAWTTPLKMPETDFSLKTHIEAYSANLPRATQEHNGKWLSLYWGDLHEHSDLSVCQRAQNPPLDDLWANQRDIEMLDFTAITDHGYNMDHPQWGYSSERVRAHYDAGAFISLLAEEWTSDHVPYAPARSVKRYGHHNLVFLDTFFPRFYDSRDEPSSSPRHVWDAIGEAEFISIPHQLADTGNTPTDWTYHDERHQPLAEIFQQRESYEALGAPRQAPAATPFKGHFLQDAWALGLIVGVIASPDHGGSKGKAAVWAEDLSREGLFKAFHARHTFGTSGARMNLWVGSGTNMMGDKVIRPQGPIPFRLWAAADRAISRVVFIRNNEEVFATEPNAKEVRLNWQDPEAPKGETLWYYVRVHRDDEELAWSSPIWFFANQHALDATPERARALPHEHPGGPPSGDPGPGVNVRKKKKPAGP